MKFHFLKKEDQLALCSYLLKGVLIIRTESDLTCLCFFKQKTDCINRSKILQITRTANLPLFQILVILLFYLVG